MAELTYKERLQPSLLDRLTDDQRNREQESRAERILSVRRLRECVRRDLSWLFNATNLACVNQEVDDYRDVAESTLNYGLPDFTGRAASGVDVPAIERQLRAAIWNFEPRLKRSSVRVKLETTPKDMDHSAVSFTIEAELWAQPIPLRLFLRTDMDLETGEVQVEEFGKADR